MGLCTTGDTVQHKEYLLSPSFLVKAKLSSCLHTPTGPPPHPSVPSLPPTPLCCPSSHTGPLNGFSTQLPQQALCTRCALSAMPSLRRPHTQAPQRPPALPLPPPHPHWTVLLSSCSSFPTGVGPPKHVPCVPARAPADSTTGGVQRAGHRHQDNSRGSQSARREGSEPRLYARPRKVPAP